MKVIFDHVTKRFPGRGKNRHNEVIAVDDFAFEIPDGKLIGLLGPSGCGKSTALNLICGLLKPTQGRILFGEEDVTDIPPERRGVGMVFQNYALYPHLSVEQNIIFPLQNLKGKERLSRDEMLEKAREVAALVQIDQLMERRPSELSGGQQQRVAIARALVKLPRVLLLDEPLSNLDARLRLQTREEIRRIQTKTGVTTIFVTHDQEEAMSISDLIVVMKDGKVQQIGRPQEVYDDPSNLFVAQFLGTPPINVFQGRISENRLFIGEEAVLSWSPDSKETPAVTLSQEGGPSPDPENAMPVTVAIRPEGFVVDADGPLSCRLNAVEVMGRDVSVVCEHPALTSAPQIRAVIDADEQPDRSAETVRFSLKPHKVLLFDAESGERLSTGW
ncbi:MAG: ABC transporter ATP-binding protein [Lachnospiraceae bacterium]|nr:ABC transporter ATP-binding protein [Lachnospiraceae bacterium]